MAEARLSPAEWYQRLSGLAVTAEHTVGPEHLDVNGHMNIGHYFSFGGHGMWERNRTDLGMPDSYIADRAMSTFTAEQHLRYFGESVEGDRLDVACLVVDAGPRAIHSAALMLNRTREELSCVMEAIAVHVDFATRRPVPFPDDVADLVAKAVEQDRTDGQLPLSGGLGIRR